MRRRHAIRLIGCTLAVSGTASAARAQGALEKITIVGPPSEDATSLYYAVKTGMPQRFGLEIELISTGSGTAATTAVVAGSYDVGRSSLLPILAAHLRDIPITMVAPLNLFSGKNPFMLLQIANDAPYRTASDLNGKTIGAPALNDLASLATRAWVDKNGGDWRSLKFTEIPNSSLEPAIVQHRIDAAIVQSAQLDATLASKSTKTLADANSAIAPAFLVAAYIARREWAQQHLDALRRFNRMLNEASSYVGTHPAETAPVVAELTKIDLAAVQKMQHRTMYASSIDAAAVQLVIDAAARYEHIPRSFPAREVIST